MGNGLPVSDGRWRLLVLSLLVAGCAGDAGDEQRTDPAPVKACLEEARVTLAPAGAGLASFYTGLRYTEAVRLTFFRHTGESATDAALLVFTSSADGARTLAGEIRKQSDPNGELDDATWDELTELHGSVYLLWEGPPEVQTRELVARCLD